MPTFPESEDDIIQLARDVQAGMSNNPTIYANPPVPMDELATELNDYDTSVQEKTQADSVAMQKTTVKNSRFGIVRDSARRLISWAEDIKGITDSDLKLIKWGKRAAPTALQAPGQCGDFEIVSINGKVVDFDWKKPRTGGKPSLYKLLRRATGATEWILHNVVTRDEAEINNLPSGTWELAVQASNNTSDGPVSNTVQVTI